MFIDSAAYANSDGDHSCNAEEVYQGEGYHMVINDWGSVHYTISMMAATHPATRPPSLRLQPATPVQ